MKIEPRFQVGDIVRVTDVRNDPTLTRLGLPIEFSNRRVRITQVQITYSGVIYWVDNTLWRWPERAFTLIERNGIMVEQKVCNCVLGFLDYGWRPHNLTTKEYILWMERDERVMEKYFTKYQRCPFCGREIDWVEEYEGL